MNTFKRCTNPHTQKKVKSAAFLYHLDTWKKNIFAPLPLKTPRNSTLQKSCNDLELEIDSKMSTPGCYHLLHLSTPLITVMCPSCYYASSNKGTASKKGFVYCGMSFVLMLRSHVYCGWKCYSPVPLQKTQSKCSFRSCLHLEHLTRILRLETLKPCTSAKGRENGLLISIYG